MLSLTENKIGTFIQHMAQCTALALVNLLIYDTRDTRKRDVAYAFFVLLAHRLAQHPHRFTLSLGMLDQPCLANGSVLLQTMPRLFTDALRIGGMHPLELLGYDKEMVWRAYLDLQGFTSCVSVRVKGGVEIVVWNYDIQEDLRDLKTGRETGLMEFEDWTRAHEIEDIVQKKRALEPPETACECLKWSLLALERRLDLGHEQGPHPQLDKGWEERAAEACHYISLPVSDRPVDFFPEPSQSICSHAQTEKPLTPPLTPLLRDPGIRPLPIGTGRPTSICTPSSMLTRRGRPALVTSEPMHDPSLLYTTYKTDGSVCAQFRFPTRAPSNRKHEVRVFRPLSAKAAPFIPALVRSSPTSAH